MDLNHRLERVADEFEITKVLTDWAYARDNGDWDLLGNCYHDDATMNISWISGPAADFIEKSKAMLAAIKPGAFSKHNVGDARIHVNGSRATSSPSRTTKSPFIATYAIRPSSPSGTG